MDYLEGALLGPMWSDTDYENRRHRGAGLWLSLLFWALLVYLTLLINKGQATVISSKPVLWGVFLFLCILVSPLLSFIYYDHGFGIRLSILIFQAFKRCSLFFLFYSLTVPHLVIKLDDAFSSSAMQSLNNAADVFLDNSGLSSSASGLVIAMVVLAFATIVFLIVLFLFLALFPTFLTKLLDKIQHLVDLLFLKLTVKQRRAYRRRYEDENSLFVARKAHG